MTKYFLSYKFCSICAVILILVIIIMKRKKFKSNLLDLSIMENFTDRNWQSTFREKEIIYDERRRRIQAYCKSQPSDFSKSYQTIFWYPEAGISMCLINKIGSSTYFEHFSNLANFKESRKKIKQRFMPPKSKIYENIMHHSNI